MKPDDPLLKILACPLDKGPLSLLVPDDVLYNPRLRRRYPILDGIPQLLPSSGEQVTDAEHEEILRRLASDRAGGPAAGPEVRS
ncbi:Trm112 family protein [Streptomyces chattanoogensis]|uniref:Trm112 family protein n=1 Tax=Streptomyces chattanoogensis TaxID=66876 RepID=UPI0036C48151